MDTTGEVHQSLSRRALVHVSVGPTHPEKQTTSIFPELQQTSSLHAQEKAASFHTWRRLSPAERARTHLDLWNGQRLISH